MTRLKLLYPIWDSIGEKYWVLEKAIRLGKAEGKGRRGQPAARRVHSIAMAMSAPLEDLTDHIRDRLSWEKKIYSCGH